MPIFELGRKNIFPPVHLASRSGILAVGGDLSPERLLEAYRRGIFPWYSEDEPIIWWHPNPRFVLFPDELKVSRSMRQFLKKNLLKITFDCNFREVISACRKPRPKQLDTWITDEMRDAYCTLHEMGFAHSVETWFEGRLVGGLYGISLGRCFFGESMFSEMSNASKAAFIVLMEKLQNLCFEIIDCQVFTAHLESLGARHIPRREFVALLDKAMQQPTLQGNWGEMAEFREE